MNRIKKIEKLVFSKKSKSELIEISQYGFEKLINSNIEIKQELPLNCKPNDIELLNSKISVVLYSNDSVPFVEIVHQLDFNKNNIGYYKSIFDLDGEFKDDFFVLK